MKKIIYTRADGGVSVITPAPKFLASFASEADGLSVIMAKDVPLDASDTEIIEDTALPADRIFRDAWRRPSGGGPITVDMPTARTIHAEHINEEQRLVVRDILEREALGENVAAEKAQLAAINVGGQIVAAQTPAELNGIWPAGFARKPS